MKIETRFKPKDTIVYLEKDGKHCNNKVIKQGKIGAVKAVATGDYDIQIVYILYDKTEINEFWCYPSMKELKDSLIDDVNYRIKSLDVGSVIGKI